MTNRVVVVGAGIGGLTAAALLARRGLDVTVLEAHVYPGGCAGTFFHQGYRFDAGATLAAGFGPQGALTRLGELLGITWPVEPAVLAMSAYLPDGSVINRWADSSRWQEERLVQFGADGEPFWRWQEGMADRLWRLALAGARGLQPWGWPPQTAAEWVGFARTGLALAAEAPARLPALALDAVRPVSTHLAGAPARLQRYVDGQLLISAQATASRANALYGAAALDMPRRGVAHVRGGIGRIAALLAGAVRQQGGQIRFRQRVTRVRRTGSAWVVETDHAAAFPADQVLFNLSPWDAAALLAADVPHRLRGHRVPADGWGAFMVYAGIAASALPADAPLHAQVLMGDALGEGSSVFLSLSLPVDPGRAPAGSRALTISTHTRLDAWWRLFERDRPAYEARKQEYVERVLDAAEIALPGLRRGIRLILPGTPISFQRFTHRSLGWVGGFPQTSLARSWGPRLGPRLWLVGDSIFPGQSVLAVALGGMRVANALVSEEVT